MTLLKPLAKQIFLNSKGEKWKKIPTLTWPKYLIELKEEKISHIDFNWIIDFKKNLNLPIKNNELESEIIQLLFVSF